MEIKKINDDLEWYMASNVMPIKCKILWEPGSNTATIYAIRECGSSDPIRVAMLVEQVIQMSLGQILDLVYIALKTNDS